MSRNPNITWDIIKNNPDKHWDYDWLNIVQKKDKYIQTSWIDVQNNPDKDWDYEDLIRNSDISFKKKRIYF